MRVEDLIIENGHEDARPVWCIQQSSDIAAVTGLSGAAEAWVKANNFKPTAGRSLVVPDADGGIAGVLFGLGDGTAGTPCGPSELLLGQLARTLPAGRYKLEGDFQHPKEAALAWGLGAYKFEQYKTKSDEGLAPTLVAPEGVDATEVRHLIEAIWLGRDLINTPASDLGPAELEQAVRELGDRHKASVSSVVGEDLLTENFPMIHAVGRASPRAPRLVDLRWQPTAGKNLPKITIVGKGICFDTGGLDLKPPAAMLLMKKDMGGAATALTLGAMIMAQQLPVDLRVLIPTADNNVSGNAFRPSDVLTSRLGKTVEIGNTDAEGRLVLADALALADEEKPDLIISLATLTGAARVALGADLPAFFTTDDALADRVGRVGLEAGDPVWRMPFWAGYDKSLKSNVADFNNISDGPFGGAITAALFLKRFVSDAPRFAHVDLYGWRPATTPLCIKGGSPQAALTLYRSLKEELTS